MIHAEFSQKSDELIDSKKEGMITIKSSKNRNTYLEPLRESSMQTIKVYKNVP